MDTSVFRRARIAGQAFPRIANWREVLPLASAGEAVKEIGMRLATLFERYKIAQCDFLKLDCEGCELEILQDSDPEVISRIDRIVMSTRYWHGDLLEALKRLGFYAVAYNPKGTYGTIVAVWPTK